MSAWRCHNSAGAKLLPDFFLDDNEKEMEEAVRAQKLKTQQRYVRDQAAAGDTEAATETTPSDSSSAKSPVADVFESMRSDLDESMVSGVGGVFSFEITGDHAATWYLDLKNGSGALGEGESPTGKADVVMKMSSATFVDMFTGKTQAVKAYMLGKLKIKGNVGIAMKLDKQLNILLKKKRAESKL